MEEKTVRYNGKKIRGKYGSATGKTGIPPCRVVFIASDGHEYYDEMLI